MSLPVQCITFLCLLVAISVAKDVSDVSIAKMAGDLLSAEQQPQFAITNDVKEWTIDWYSDIGDDRSSLTVAGPLVDPKKLLEDILCGNLNLKVNSSGRNLIFIR